MIILVCLSALVLFGFMLYCIADWGLTDCFSRYSYKWGVAPRALNLWSVDIIGSAILLIPVMIELGTGSSWQFLGFLAPVSMFLVGLTPRWATNNTQYVVHNIGVVLAVIFSVAYAILIPKTVWAILILCVLAGIATIIKKKAFIFWLEIAMYLAIYVTITTQIFQSI